MRLPSGTTQLCPALDHLVRLSARNGTELISARTGQAALSCAEVTARRFHGDLGGSRWADSAQGIGLKVSGGFRDAAEEVAE